MFEEFGQEARVRDLPDPAPSPEGVVVRVGATGLCRSDWHGWMGHDPDIALPHVGAGVTITEPAALDPTAAEP